MPWSRELNNNPGVPQPNPNFLDGETPDYQIFISHVLPDPSPAAAKQMWQVVTCHVVKMDQDCKVTSKFEYFIDIIDIDGRSKIGDNLGRIWHSSLCFVLELCTHIVGFDDGKSNYGQQTNVKATRELAERIKGEMTGPTTTFQTAYVYRNAACRCDFGLFQWIFGEYVWVEGIGTFPTPLKSDENHEEGTEKRGQSVVAELLVVNDPGGLAAGTGYNAPAHIAKTLKVKARRRPR